MRCRQSAGFSLIELVMVIAVLIILMAFAVPMMSVGERAKVNNAMTLVRETLQTARLRAVAVNHALEVRFNCPEAGQFRIVESGFGEDGRCDSTNFPYPAPSDAAYQSPPKPRYDGPVLRVDPRVALSSGDPGLVLQFLPDGRTMKVEGGSPSAITTVSVTVSADDYAKTIDINNLGRVSAR